MQICNINIDPVTKYTKQTVKVKNSIRMSFNGNNIESHKYLQKTKPSISEIIVSKK